MTQRSRRALGHVLCVRCASTYVTIVTIQDTISRSANMASDSNEPPRVPVPDYRPVERFWPYVDLPEQPTDEELAQLDPDLSEALFGTPKLPFSLSLEFPRFDGDEYHRALAMARASAEYREIGTGDRVRHRARFYPKDALALRDLFEVVGHL